MVIQLDDFDKYLAEQLKNPKFKKEYDALEPDYQMISSLITARAEKKTYSAGSLKNYRDCSGRFIKNREWKCKSYFKNLKKNC